MYYHKALNARHLYNLAMLADFLQKEVTDKQFNIKNFRMKNSKILTPFKSLNDCGSIGCALGWAPFVIKPAESTYEVFYDYFDHTVTTKLSFESYSEEAFGCTVNDNSLGDFMFGGVWGVDKVQRTRLATVKRIREVVEAEGEFLSGFERKLLRINKKYVENVN